MRLVITYASALESFTLGQRGIEEIVVDFARLFRDETQTNTQWNKHTTRKQFKKHWCGEPEIIAIMISQSIWIFHRELQLKIVILLPNEGT